MAYHGAGSREMKGEMGLNELRAIFEYFGLPAILALLLIGLVVGYLVGRHRNKRAKQKYLRENLPISKPFNIVVSRLSLSNEPIETEVYRAEYVAQIQKEVDRLTGRNAKLKGDIKNKLETIRRIAR